MRHGLILVALALGTIGCGDKVTATREAPAPFAWPQGPTPSAVLHIRDMGAIEIALHPQIAPATVDNFVKLAREGSYDGTTFHRVIPGFMIQGGDLNTKDKAVDDAKGGPGHRIEDEFNAAPHEPGTVSMANLGQPNTADSQFFIVHGSARFLDGKHTVFGRVVDGMGVVDAITKVEVDLHGRWGPKDRPIAKILVERVDVERVEVETAEIQQPAG